MFEGHFYMDYTQNVSRLDFTEAMLQSTFFFDYNKVRIPSPFAMRCPPILFIRVWGPGKMASNSI